MNETGDAILIVDDSKEDVELVVGALRKHLPGVTTLVARDGAEAITILTDRPASQAPHLILLDLKMPKVDGFEVLRRVKGDAATRSIPVVVLTSSALETDVQLAYSLGANSYVVKPMWFEEFTETVGRIGEYWLRVDRGLSGS
ncbi:MAG: response regulator [Gemmatimonadetes bacterium]|nr:response regulator [Gemmatimonadota bacterium]